MDAFLKAAQARAFSWETWNCALFAAAHIDHITGSSLYDQYSGAVADAAGAQELIGEWGSLEAIVREFLGDPLAGVKKAQRGDIVMFESDSGPGLGIVDLTGTHFAGLDQAGLKRQKLGTATAAWRV